MKLIWDAVGERYYETGCDRGTLYPMEGETYGKGVAWNGLTNVDESPSGAEPTALWANNHKYLNLYSAEDYAATIQAYTYPEEFEACDGTRELAPGVLAGQQTRKPFGLSFRTLKGSDTEGNSKGYKIHLIYGAMAKPSSKTHSTVNDSPEAVQFSWEVSTTPVEIEGGNPTAAITIDSDRVGKKALMALEDMLYGTADSEPKLPTPAELVALVNGATE